MMFVGYTHLGTIYCKVIFYYQIHNAHVCMTYDRGITIVVDMSNLMFRWEDTNLFSNSERHESVSHEVETLENL